MNKILQPESLSAKNSLEGVSKHPRVQGKEIAVHAARVEAEMRSVEGLLRGGVPREMAMFKVRNAQTALLKQSGAMDRISMIAGSEVNTLQSKDWRTVINNKEAVAVVAETRKIEEATLSSTPSPLQDSLSIDSSEYVFKRAEEAEKKPGFDRNASDLVYLRTARQLREKMAIEEASHKEHDDSVDWSYVEMAEGVPYGSRTEGFLPQEEGGKGGDKGSSGDHKYDVSKFTLGTKRKDEKGVGGVPPKGPDGPKGPRGGGGDDDLPPRPDDENPENPRTYPSSIDIDLTKMELEAKKQEKDVTFTVPDNSIPSVRSKYDLPLPKTDASFAFVKEGAFAQKAETYTTEGILSKKEEHSLPPDARKASTSSPSVPQQAPTSKVLPTKKERFSTDEGIETFFRERRQTVEEILGEEKMKELLTRAPKNIERVEGKLESRRKKALEKLGKFGLKGLSGTLETFGKLSPKKRLLLGVALAGASVLAGGLPAYLAGITLSTTSFASDFYKRKMAKLEVGDKVLSDVEKGKVALKSTALGLVCALGTSYLFVLAGEALHGAGDKISHFFDSFRHNAPPAPVHQPISVGPSVQSVVSPSPAAPLPSVETVAAPPVQAQVIQAPLPTPPPQIIQAPPVIQQPIPNLLEAAQQSQREIILAGINAQRASLGLPPITN